MSNNSFLNLSRNNIYVAGDSDADLTSDPINQLHSLPRTHHRAKAKVKVAASKPSTLEAELEETVDSLRSQLVELQTKLAKESDCNRDLNERLSIQDNNYKLIIGKISDRYEQRVAKLIAKDESWRVKYVQGQTELERLTNEAQAEKLSLIATIESLQQQLVTQRRDHPYKVLLDIALARLTYLESSASQNKYRDGSVGAFKEKLLKSKSCPDIKDGIIDHADVSILRVSDNQFSAKSKNTSQSNKLKDRDTPVTTLTPKSNHHDHNHQIHHSASPINTFAHKNLLWIFPNMRRNHSDRALEKRGKRRAEVTSWHGAINDRRLKENSTLTDQRLELEVTSDELKRTSGGKTVKTSFMQQMKIWGTKTTVVKDAPRNADHQNSEIASFDSRSGSNNSATSSVKSKISKHFPKIKRQNTPLSLSVSLDQAEVNRCTEEHPADSSPSLDDNTAEQTVPSRCSGFEKAGEEHITIVCTGSSENLLVVDDCLVRSDVIGWRREEVELSNPHRSGVDSCEPRVGGLDERVTQLFRGNIDVDSQTGENRIDEKEKKASEEGKRRTSVTIQNEVSRARVVDAIRRIDRSSCENQQLHDHFENRMDENERSQINDEKRLIRNVKNESYKTCAYEETTIKDFASRVNYSTTESRCRQFEKSVYTRLQVQTPSNSGSTTTLKYSNRHIDDVISRNGGTLTSPMRKATSDNDVGAAEIARKNEEKSIEKFPPHSTDVDVRSDLFVSESTDHRHGRINSSSPTMEQKTEPNGYTSSKSVDPYEPSSVKSISNFEQLGKRRNGLDKNVFSNKMRKTKSVSMLDKLSANIRTYINKF